MLLFDCETCSRCGGSGHFSYCQRWGTICFKCAGAKFVLTKKGRAAQALYDELLSKKASELKPGDKIRELGVTNGGETYWMWVPVEAVVPYDNSGNHSFVNGVEIPQRTDLLKIVSEKLTICGVAPEQVFRIAATAEQKLMARARALGYQDTLTKQGLPRKKAAA